MNRLSFLKRLVAIPFAVLGGAKAIQAEPKETVILGDTHPSDPVHTKKMVEQINGVIEKWEKHIPDNEMDECLTRHHGYVYDGRIEYHLPKKWKSNKK